MVLTGRRDYRRIYTLIIEVILLLVYIFGVIVSYHRVSSLWYTDAMRNTLDPIVMIGIPIIIITDTVRWLDLRLFSNMDNLKDQNFLWVI